MPTGCNLTVALSRHKYLKSGYSFWLLSCFAGLVQPCGELEMWQDPLETWTWPKMFSSAESVLKAKLCWAWASEERSGHVQPGMKGQESVKLPFLAAPYIQVGWKQWLNCSLNLVHFFATWGIICWKCCILDGSFSTEDPSLFWYVFQLYLNLSCRFDDAVMIKL